ncbi:hypothetical protein BDR07DRAFT_618397 [Suillus spraguei]|nr:hypothetical protein BDR07DRAFT_618397 [Suillus spraguei]
MSCCCRAFTDPALDILWRSMHSFAPFISLIPQSASFVDDTRTSDCDLLKYCCNPLNGWQSFDKYAARVWSLHLGEHDNYSADLSKNQDCYTRLTVIRGQDEFHPFPKLRSLAYVLSGPISPQAKPFPPSLRSLTLVCHNTLDCDPIELALDRAVAEAPHLKELCIVGLMRTNSLNLEVWTANTYQRVSHSRMWIEGSKYSEHIYYQFYSSDAMKLLMHIHVALPA